MKYKVTRKQEEADPDFQFQIERQLIGLRKLNFTWKAISEIVGVSERTIHRRRAECPSSVCENNFSGITAMMNWITR